MNNHLHFNKRSLALLITLLLGLGMTWAQPKDAIPHPFSVGEGKFVYFSKGNLQYQASTRKWRFAKQQYDMVGKANSKISSSNSGWIDLFEWNSANNPTSHFVYDDLGKQYPSHFMSPLTTDWGSKMGDEWRTLTAAEWGHVLYVRHPASGMRYARAKVVGVEGVILLPDDWDESTFDLSPYSNSISSTEWANTLEPNGAVFLPAAGMRHGTNMYGINDNAVGAYWSSSGDGKHDRNFMFFAFDYDRDISIRNAGVVGNTVEDFGLESFAVRLVCPAPNPVETLLEKVNAYLNEGKGAEVINDLNKLHEFDPNNAQFCFVLGTIYGDENNADIYDTDKAVQFYEDAIKINPDYYDAVYNLGVMYITMSNKLMTQANELPQNQKKEYDALVEQANEMLRTGLPYLRQAYDAQPFDEMKNVLRAIYARLNMMEEVNALDAQ